MFLIGFSVSSVFAGTSSEKVKNNIKMRDDGVNINASGTRATSTKRGSVTAEQHRSEVATFVQSLLRSSDREGGIGPEVRVIAKSQNDSASTTADAMSKIEKRGKFKKFLIGDDYKNLGKIRSELATTSNNIARLQKLLDSATSTSERAELVAQIQKLETIKEEINKYLNDHKEKFSLFGWFVRLGK